MIWSVSTLDRRRGTPIPVCVRNASITPGPPESSGCHVLRWPRPPAARRGTYGRPCPVGLRGGRAAFARGELVGIHPEAHRAPGRTPLGTGGGEDLVEALGLGLEPHPH